MWFQTNAKLNRGFTLLELLVVIAIVGILASVILASLNASRDKAGNASALAQIEQYQKALDLYYTDTGEFPGGQSSAARATERCVVTSLCTGWVGVNNTDTQFSAILSPDYISAVPDTVVAAYNGCSGTLFNDNSSCTTNDYSIFFLLEGENENCGDAFAANNSFGYAGNRYTMCRATP